MSCIRWAFSTKIWAPTKSEWLCGLASIQEEERKRVMQFVYKKDAKSALIGRLLLRKVIAENTSIPYSDILLARTERGKPYLVNSEENLYFNVSHQGDFVVLAAELTKNGSQTVKDFFHTMRRQFTSYEWQIIQRCPTERKQLEMFMRHWCLKESYVKALGVGIGLLKKLQSIEFHITSSSVELDNKNVTRDTMLFLDNEFCEDWCFEESKLDEDHQVVVALRRTNQDNKTTTNKSSVFTMLTINDLISNSSSFVDEQCWKEFEAKKESPWKI